MRAEILANGIVQGVGFRPFVYRTAKKSGLKGFVQNVGNGVFIVLEGEKKKIDDFLLFFKNELPPLARLDGLEICHKKETGIEDFGILKSKKAGTSESALPPDVCICSQCMQEVKNKIDRRSGYPFTICVDCGPRFTIIRSIPYDRENTAMDEFPMCAECKKEYENPLNRRYHAEPVCCPVCGPKYELYKGQKKIPHENPVKKTAKLLDDGAIVAIMGVGGTHLAARIDDGVIKHLRKRFQRPQKPFALMAKDMDAVKELAYVSKKEEELLRSLRRPIVVLKKKENALADSVSPGLDNIGIMLPYTALHELLFSYAKENVFVMTSANLPGEPILNDPKLILESGFSDYSLLHNRDIYNRADDSVIRVVGDKVAFIRRSRGWVPEPIELDFTSEKTVLALGAELNVTACILKGKRAVLSQYIGDTTKVLTLDFLLHALRRLKELGKVEDFDIVAVDLHPHFNTTREGEKLAKEYNAELLRVQHHHAHIASLMAESHMDEIIGISSDGVGYGSDGNVWGGEILYCKEGDYTRLGHLQSHPMPGGDLAATYPARMAAGILSGMYKSDELEKILKKRLKDGFRSQKELEMVIKQLERDFNVAYTTSTGRVLDAVSAILGACYERTYEGEPAMKLEGLASKGQASIDIPYKIERKNGIFVGDTGGIVDAVISQMNTKKREDLAASAQLAVARVLAEIAIKSAKKTNVDIIGMSGGVAYNNAIVSEIRRILNEEDYRFLTQTKAPCGDGGISLGQCYVGQQSYL
ncbi:MAG: carbamoyltransferase HypF [Candidatus Hydrothermarchaeales archaeon]